MRRITMALTLALLLVAGMAWGDARTRIFVDSVEYVGPQITMDGVLYVDPVAFATETGWSAVHRDGAVAIAPEGATLPENGSGLFVSGQAFSGQTGVQNGKLFVSLADLVSALGGSVKTVPEYHAVRISGVAGMPNLEVLKRRSGHQMVSVDVKTGPDFTLVEYYATW